MDNHIITILEKFEKPDASFLQEKECLICLEPFDLESNKIVQLPCKCSNSTYHIVCIIKLLHSGANKNFCPHCKSIYEIPLQQIQATGNQIVPYIVVINTPQQEIHNSQMAHFKHILCVHIFSNSIMNFINICLSRLSFNYKSVEELQLLMLFYVFTPFNISNAEFKGIKKIKKHKINSRNFTYDGLTFSCSFFLLEQVKDEIWKHNGRSCFSIQD